MQQLDMQAISTYATFTTSFDKLPEHTRRLLRLFSFYHWSKIPLALVALAAKHQFSTYERPRVKHGNSFDINKRVLEEIFLRNGEWDVTNLDDMTISLQSYSLTLVVPGVETLLLQMHPLVHEWVHLCIPEDEKEEYQSAAIQLLALGSRYDHTPATQYLASHVIHMSPLWDHLQVNDTIAFGSILQVNGMYQQAAQLREGVVRRLKEIHDPEYFQVTICLWELAITYQGLGRLKEAMSLQEEILELWRRTMGERHLNTISASSILASTYGQLGRLNDALKLQAEVLKLRREILGESYTATISASSNLASTYRSLGRHSEAIALHEYVLQMRKNLLGKRHPETLRASSDLALTYLDSGRPNNAVHILKEVLDLRKEILGERRPDTISTAINLSLAYRQWG